MSNFILTKQPDEIVPCSIDFRLRIPTGETINAGTSTVKVFNSLGEDKTTDMTVGSLAVSGTVVSIVLKAGLNDEDFNVEFLAVTTPAAYKFEDEVKLLVRETPA